MRTSAVATACAVILSGSPIARARTLWGGLEAGAHVVGYRSRVEIDPLRSSLDGKTAGRAVIVQAWYPAGPVENAPMRFRRYVLDEYGTADADAAIAEFAEDLHDRGAGKDQVEGLLASPTRAHRDAPLAVGRFPLVLYFHTGAPSKSIQCEYLASHGFIVVSTAVRGTFEKDLDVALSGAETQARDLEFAAAWAARFWHLDGNAIGVVGMSFGGISELVFAERHPEVKALVSLDGGAGSLSGAALVQESPYFETARLRAPMLLLYQPGGADLTFLESLRYSERTFARFPALHHQDFSGSGFFPRAPSAADDSSEGPREDVNRLMCRFLLAHLAGDRASMRALDEAETSPSYTLTRRAALPAPPSFEELKAMIRAGSIASVQGVFDRLKDRDPAPFSQETFRKLGSWLFDQGRNEDARSLFSMQLSMYPASSRSHFMLGIACQRLDDKRGARAHFEKVLELLPTDFDLDIPTRKRYEATAKEGIAALDATSPTP